MKHLALFIIYFPIFSLSLFAQVKISTGSSLIDVQVKRAFAQGDDVCIDLMLTSHTKWDMISLHACEVYDDEGNHYQLMGVSFQVSDEMIDVMVDGKRRCIFSVAKDIPRKVRVIIRNVDEYASAFSLVKIEWWGDRSSANIINTTIKDLQITRE